MVRGVEPRCTDVEPGRIVIPQALSPAEVVCMMMKSLECGVEPLIRRGSEEPHAESREALYRSTHCFSLVPLGSTKKLSSPSRMTRPSLRSGPSERAVALVKTSRIVRFLPTLRSFLELVSA